MTHAPDLNGREDLRLEDLFEGSPEAIACPFRHFEALQQTSGLYYSPELDAHVASRYSDLGEIVADPDRFSSRIPFGRIAMEREKQAIQAMMAEDPELAALMAGLRPRRIPMLASSDNPRHRLQRKIALSALSGKRLTAIQPWIRTTTEALFDGFESKPAVDVVSAVSIPLPVRVIARLLGVEEDMYDQFKRWSDAFIFAAGAENVKAANLKRALLQQQDLFAYLAEHFEQRKSDPRDDMLTAMLQAYQDSGEPFEIDEVIAMAAQLLVAGNETTSALISHVLHTLATRPDLVTTLRERPKDIARFVEEVLRREGPAQANFRQVKEDATIGGVSVKKGTQIMMMWNAASRDPTVFGDCELDASFGPGGRHFGFGFGEHFCIGAPLARLEAKIVTETVLDRFSSIELANEGPLRFAPTYLSRAMLMLPLRFTA